MIACRIAFVYTIERCPKYIGDILRGVLKERFSNKAHYKDVDSPLNEQVSFHYLFHAVSKTISYFKNNQSKERQDDLYILFNTLCNKNSEYTEPKDRASK